jgi:DNA-binding response OmpR family regulator
VSAELRKTVLVVDDDGEFRAVIIHFLRHHGYAPMEAADGQAALDLIDGAKMDLVILDVMMPGIDGFATLNRIRNTGSNVPVILLTACSVDDDIMRGYTVGADLYLVKPVSMDTLCKSVDYLIGDLTSEEKAALEQEI